MVCLIQIRNSKCSGTNNNFLVIKDLLSAIKIVCLCTCLIHFISHIHLVLLFLLLHVSFMSWLYCRDKRSKKQDTHDTHVHTYKYIDRIIHSHQLSICIDCVVHTQTHTENNRLTTSPNQTKLDHYTHYTYTYIRCIHTMHTYDMTSKTWL